MPKEERYNLNGILYDAKTTQAIFDTIKKETLESVRNHTDRVAILSQLERGWKRIAIDKVRWARMVRDLEKKIGRLLNLDTLKFDIPLCVKCGKISSPSCPDHMCAACCIVAHAMGRNALHI